MMIDDMITGNSTFVQVAHAYIARTINESGETLADKIKNMRRSVDSYGDRALKLELSCDALMFRAELPDARLKVYMDCEQAVSEADCHARQEAWHRRRAAYLPIIAAAEAWQPTPEYAALKDGFLKFLHDSLSERSVDLDIEMTVSARNQTVEEYRIRLRNRALHEKTVAEKFRNIAAALEEQIIALNRLMDTLKDVEK